MAYTVVDEFVGSDPPPDEDRCWCGRPATIPVEWKGCRYCGGGECGDYPGTDWICAVCFEQGEDRED